MQVGVSFWILHVFLLQLSGRELNLISQKLLKKLAVDSICPEGWRREASLRCPLSEISMPLHSFDALSLLLIHIAFVIC